MSAEFSPENFHGLDDLGKALMRHELVLNAVRRVVANSRDRLSEKDLESVLLALYPTDGGDQELDLTKDEMESAFESRGSRVIPRLKEMVEDELEDEFKLMDLLEQEAGGIKEDKSATKKLLIDAEKLGTQLVAEAHDLYKNFKALLMRHTQHSKTTYKPALDTVKLSAEGLVASVRDFETIVLTELFAHADVDILEHLDDDLDRENSRVDEELSSKQQLLEKYEENSGEFLAAAEQLKQIEREISDKLATLAVADDSSLNISAFPDE